MGLQVMKESDYNRYRAFRGLGEVDLGSDGYLLTSDMGETVNKVYDAAMREDVAIPFGDVTLHPKAKEVDEDASTFADSVWAAIPERSLFPMWLLSARTCRCIRATYWATIARVSHTRRPRVTCAPIAGGRGPV
ncbi:MAG: hypothetical protein ACLTSX_05780 [Collinsella sp.]